MGGELAINVEKVSIDEAISTFDNTDLRIVDKDGHILFICGKNDWAFLMLEALEPVKKRARDIVMKIGEKIQENKIEAVVLGKKEKRDMDVFFGGEGKCNRILGFPVIESKEETCFKFLVEDKN